MEKEKITKNKILLLLKKNDSKIKSFLTDPLLKNKPQRQNKVIVIWDCIKIVIFPLFW